ncbi:DUF4249 domain-containing protein [Spirosoma utsteinense]|uniref:DUF4249 domain-containing protein n=1 Tax=Spirosoma utsteinense TaxID=2585773 RepID=A0ABR6W8I9_9BACT|nr:DUF4249 domain-containing protein [Spirosoma utsteinense]MBC3783940.1 hypothetical protein [Spirosoma utsteinense]MBC3792574.1 hypothetical protein [Spirosoma utsteinense]
MIPFRSVLFLIFLPTLVLSCVTEFQPDRVSLPSALVVEGQITDQPGPYTVRLTRSADYSYTAINLLETGAVVSIEDNLGNRETLREQAPGGVYQTRPDGIQGVAGRRYKLIVQTQSGTRYESEPEVITAAPPIVKLYSEYRSELVPGTAIRKQGWDVFLDTKDPETTGNYYRWEWTHYEPISVCQKTQLRSGAFTGISCCTECWDIARCYDCISVNSDAEINGKAITGQLIMRAPYTSTTPYYVEIEQQALSRGAYLFWKSVRQLVNNTGGLFDAAPQAVQGNIRCTSDPNTAVYGYFGATGVSRLPFYVDRSQGQGVPDLEPPVTVPFPTNPPCVVCENSLYRTRIKPRGWVY